MKIVDEELKIDVREDIKAANMTANMRPRTPEGNNSFTSLTKARFVHPDLQKKRERNMITYALTKGQIISQDFFFLFSIPLLIQLTSFL